MREITWFAGYDGIKMKFFNYNVATETKEGSRATTWIKADEASATVNQLSVTLPEFRKSNVTIGCEVRVLKDNRGGGVRSNKLYKEVRVLLGYFFPVPFFCLVSFVFDVPQHNGKVPIPL